MKYYFDSRFDVRLADNSVILREGDRIIRLAAPDKIHKQLLSAMIDGCDVEQFVELNDAYNELDNIQLSVKQLEEFGYIHKASSVNGLCKYPVEIIDPCLILSESRSNWFSSSQDEPAKAILMVLAGENTVKVEEAYKKAILDHIPVIPITPFDGKYALVGPVGVSTEFSCANCVSEWHSGLIPKAEPYYSSRYLISSSRNQDIVNSLINSLVCHLLRELMRPNRFLSNKALLISYELGLPQVDILDVPKMPACPVCGVMSGVQPFAENGTL